jgi:hypothetical protein
MLEAARMPKRSNQFQKIVTYIADQLAPLGATVKESVELQETGMSGVFREVDTLIEVGAGLTRVRIAIESRERSRKGDIQWVDDLIGKYALLPIDRVLAISNAGFSAAAKLKAEVHNIELLSLQDVASTDWPSKFQKLGIASLVSRLELVHIKFHTTPPFTGKVSLDDRIRCDDGSGRTVEGTVREFIEEVRPAVIAGIQKHISANFLSIYKTLEDLKKTAVIDRSLPGNSLSLLTEDSCYLIDKVSFRVVAHNERTIAPVEHRLLGNDAMLSSSRVGDLDLVIVQTAGASQGKVFLQPVTTRKRHKQQAK